MEARATDLSYHLSKLQGGSTKEDCAGKILGSEYCTLYSFHRPLFVDAFVLPVSQLHRAGKTTEAKADLARLAVIRKEREAAAARKAAEKADQDAAKAKALAASGRKR